MEVYVAEIKEIVRHAWKENHGSSTVRRTYIDNIFSSAKSAVNYYKGHTKEGDMFEGLRDSSGRVWIRDDFWDNWSDEKMARSYGLVKSCYDYVSNTEYKLRIYRREVLD